jgi:hypothetical protein
MPHNGNLGQINVGFGTYGARGFEFLNHVKLASSATHNTDQTKLDPTLYNADGYPLSSTATSGSYRQIRIPVQSLRGGTFNYKIRWTGRCSLTLGGNSFSLATDYEGAFTPTGGSVIGDGSYSMDFQFFSIDEGNPPTNLEIFHEDDEAALDAGQIFGTQFLERVNKFGVIRFLNPKNYNGRSVSKWDQERPESFISYQGPYCPSGYYKGATTNSSGAYSLAADGFVLEDKAAVVLRWNATAASGSGLTLNVNGTGAVPISSMAPNFMADSVRPRSGSYSALIYDESLNLWLTRGGHLFSGGVGWTEGWPIDICLKLCRDVGAHPWFNLPFLTLDPPTDYTTNLATRCKAFAESDATWMRPFFEGPNEQWNTANEDFYQTQYGAAKAAARAGWGTDSFDAYHQYGRIMSLAGAELEAVYGAGNFNLVCGTQMVSASNQTSNGYRIIGKHVTVDGGTPAKDYVTHVAPAIYCGVGYTTQQEVDFSYVLGTIEDDEAKQAYTDGLIEACPSRDGRQLRTFLADWKTFCDTHGLILTSYEGAHGLDYPVADRTANITGITNAAQAVVTVASANLVAPVGSTVHIVAPTGMTGIGSTAASFTGGGSANINGTNVFIDGRRVRFALFNGAVLPSELSINTDYYVVSTGNPFQISATDGGSALTFATTGSGDISCRPVYEVMARNLTTRTITLDTDTTSLSSYTSGGTVNMIDSLVNGRDLRVRFRKAPALEDMIQKVFTQYTLYGGVYPSTFDLSGDGDWSKMATIYGPPWPEYDGIVTFSTSPNTGVKAMKLQLTSS